MGYVKHLLEGKLVAYKEMYASAKERGQIDLATDHIKIISELEYVLGILEHNETYQKY